MYNCNTCGKTFTIKSNLKIHEITHTGVKPYACQLCNKTFSQLHNLKYHALIHSAEKPYFCKLCEQAFRNSASLKIHERNHTGERPYVCEICKRGFNKSGNLKRHEKMHTAEKPYVCETCNKAFLHQSHLNIHWRTRTGEKPYVCSNKKCTKAFSELGKLKRHEKTHTGEKPYVCESCGKTFGRKDQLRRHGRRIHSGEKLYRVKNNSRADPMKHRENSDVVDKSVDVIYAAFFSEKQQKKSPFAAKPFGCGFCDEMFVDETHFLKHCSLHLGDGDIAISDLSKQIGIDSFADLTTRNSLRWFGHFEQIKDSVPC